jgi:hypothetical protein
MFAALAAFEGLAAVAFELLPGQGQGAAGQRSIT